MRRNTAILIFLLLPAFGAVFAQGTGTQEDVKVEPLPEPPAVRDQVKKSDVIVRAVLLHSRSYKIGSKAMNQARFRVIAPLRSSSFFPLQSGEEFTVQYVMKPDVYGPHFMETPEPGEYVVLLELKNVMLQDKVIGQIVQLIFPNPFALYEPTPDILQAAGVKR